MTNQKNRFEIHKFSEVFIIFYVIWIYSSDNNFSTKKSYLNNQFKLKYGSEIEEYLINNPSLEQELKDDLETKDLVNSIFSLILIQNSLDKKISNYLIDNYSLKKTSTNLEKLSQYINQKLEKIIDQINNNQKPVSGSYRGRLSTEPENFRKTLLDNNNA